MGMFEPNMETMTRDELEHLQDKKLRHLVSRAYNNVKMYHDKFKGIPPRSIHGLRDLEKIPFTTKNDLRTYSLRDRLAVPEIEIIFYSTSSGTTGRPVVEGLTFKDIQVASIWGAKTFSAATITKEDKVLEPMPGGGLRTVLVAQAGLARIGAKIIHTGPGRTKEFQIPILMGRYEESMKPSVILGYANYMLRIADVAKDMGIDPKEFGVKKLVCGGEMCSEGRRRILEETYDAHAYDMFGLVEASIGPGAAGECEAQNGMHIWENYFIVEVINPQTGESLGTGEQGELVITAFEKDAHPIIRYRTGDIAKILSVDKCSCGRTNMRLGRIIGRTDDRFKVRGVQLYPSEIENFLSKIQEVGSEYNVVVKEINYVDEMLITVESKRGYSGSPNALAQEISRTFDGVFNVTPKVEVFPYGTLEREEEGKIRRVMDLRKK